MLSVKVEEGGTMESSPTINTLEQKKPEPFFSVMLPALIPGSDRAGVCISLFLPVVRTGKSERSAGMLPVGAVCDTGLPYLMVGLFREEQRKNSFILLFIVPC